MRRRSRASSPPRTSPDRTTASSGRRPRPSTSSASSSSRRSRACRASRARSPARSSTCSGAVARARTVATLLLAGTWSQPPSAAAPRWAGDPRRTTRSSRRRTVRITLETRGPSATGFGITDVAQPSGGITNAVCIDTSRPVSVAVATPEDNDGSSRTAAVSVPPPAGLCAEGVELFVRLQNASSGASFYFVAY